jgi:tRNA 5-methylaminomethyl-2-thiouridine biosynthesis bifunctional protein
LIMAKRALVIGAGLAGCATAYALVQRGWHVTLLDQASAPAQGASALPVGMLSPNHAQNPTPMSRLCALGLQATRAHLERLLPHGNGWQATTVCNYALAKAAPDTGVAIATNVDQSSDNTANGAPDRALRQALELELQEPAHLVSPAALAHAWLAACAPDALQFIGGQRIATLQRNQAQQQWQALNAQGGLVAHGDVAVVCNAFAASELLPATLPLGLRAVAGQMTLGPTTDAYPESGTGNASALRYKGVYAPSFQTFTGERVWSMGATYRRGVSQPAATQQDAAANRANLATLAESVPQAERALQRLDQQAAAGTLRSWVGVRCASTDRLPLCGALPSATALVGLDSGARLDDVATAQGLFTLVALGSRGLSLAALLGDVLANHISGQACTALPPDLQRAIDPRRAPLQVLRQARRQAAKAQRAANPPGP